MDRELTKRTSSLPYSKASLVTGATLASSISHVFSKNTPTKKCLCSAHTWWTYLRRKSVCAACVDVIVAFFCGKTSRGNLLPVGSAVICFLWTEWKDPSYFHPKITRMLT